MADSLFDRSEAVRLVEEHISKIVDEAERARLLAAFVLVRDQLPLPGVYDRVEPHKTIKL